MTTVAFLGLGSMGSRMARRLLDAGNDLVVWNRTPEKMQPLVAAGANPAESPAQAARQAEVVITMVANPVALQAVTEGPDGTIAAAAPYITFIEMSTVGPAALAERWTPLLSVLGSPLHVGPLGSGAAAKLVANGTLFGVMGMLGETLALARALGLTQEAAFDVLAVTALADQAARRRPAIESGDYPPRFPLSLARKDADLIRDAAEAAGVDLRVGAAARSWVAEAEAAGWGERDYAAVLAWILGEGRSRQ